MKSDTYTIKENPPSHKQPRLILENIFAFPPNRETMGGTAYFLKTPAGNVLIDSPLWHEANREFCRQQGGIHWLFFTHRGGMGRQVSQIGRNFPCKILIQEQEAYLLPNLEVISFTEEYELNSQCQLIWTPGHSPGSSCLYYANLGGVLFTGRHLLPNRELKAASLRVKKTFHWRRQVQSERKIRDRFSSETLHYICPGANTGFLRGKGYIDYD